MEKDFFEKRFKQKAENIRICPSEHTWERIESKMTNPIKPFRKWLSVAAMLILLAGIGLLTHQRLTNTKYLGEFEGPLAVVKTQNNFSPQQLNAIYSKR